MPGTPFGLPVLISLLGGAQAILIALALITVRRGNRTANKILAALAVVIAIGVTASVLNHVHYFRVYPHLSRINHPFDFLGLPLLFLYVKALISKSKPLGNKSFLHFVPALLCVLYLSPYYAQSASYKLYHLSSVEGARWYYIRSALALSQAFIYLTLIVVMVIKYSREVRTRSVSSEKAVLSQLHFLAISFLALAAIALVRYVIDIRYPAYMLQTSLILPISVTCIVYILAYLGLRRSEGLMAHDETIAAKRYEKSTLTSDRADMYLKRLQHAMVSDKVYTNSNLTLATLAARLGVPAQHLSQVVNEKLNQSFLDFINSHRVEEAKKRLIDPALSHLTILAIAEQVGFNSKSTFNAVFKRHTNTTPSDFRRVAGNGSLRRD